MFYRSLALSFLIIFMVVVSTHSFVSAVAVALSLLKTAPPLIIVALAAGIVISAGEIDIASGSVFALTGMFLFVGLKLVTFGTHESWQDLGLTYAILLGSSVLIMLIYLIIGLSVAVLGFPALLSTLAVLLAGRGLSVLIQNVISNGTTIESSGFASTISSTLTLPPAMLPTLGPGWIWATLICIISAAWRYLTFSGLRHIAVGMDRRSAARSGVSIRHAQILAFVAAGLLVAIAAHLTLIQISQGSWAGNFGWGLELSAIAAAVIGGCRITGGRFNPFGIALGAIFVRATEDAAGSFNLPSECFYIVLGLGLLVAAFLDRLSDDGTQTKILVNMLRRW